MNRIRALNQSDSEHQLDTSICVLPEKALEDIKHQYIDALAAKHSGQHDVAIDLFQQILQHDEIAPITVESTTTREQFRVKYCCYKNLAELYHIRTSDRMALRVFLQAHAMDSTDVHFSSKFARLALEQRHTDLAGTVLKRCFELNANHMPTMDGILEMLCHKEDYLEAYGWAIYCHGKFPKYQRAIDVICDVHHTLNGTPLLQDAFSVPFNVHAIINKRSLRPSLFTQPNHSDDGDVVMDLDEPNFNEFHLNATPSFLTFGHMIELIYAKSTQVTSYLTTKLSLGNICDVNNANVDSTSTSTTTTTTAAMEKTLFEPMSHNFDESCAVTATAAAAEVVCSSQPIMLNTSPIQTIFQEVLPQCFSNDTVVHNDADVQLPSFIRAILQPNYLKDVKTTLMTDNATFHSKSTTYFHSFMDTLKDRTHFSMLDVMFEWLKWVSKCYRIQLPIELQTLYINIFEHHCNHIDYGNWEGLSHTKIHDLIAMELFYIELNVAANVRDGTVQQHRPQQQQQQHSRFFDRHLIRRLHHISCKRTLFIDDCDPILEVRLHLLRLQCAIETEDLEMANDLFDCINTYFTGPTTSPSPSLQIESVHLPNQIYCKFLDRSVIGNEMQLFNCLQLMQQCQWQPQQQQPPQCWQQQHRIRDMLLAHRKCNFESKHLSWWQQSEMLVEWHWCAERFDECLHWCEIALNESIQRCKQNANNPVVSIEFAQHIRFLTVYLEHLVDDNHCVLNSLNIDSKKRLVRSLAHLMDIHYGNRVMAQIESLQKSVSPTPTPPPPPPPTPLFNATKFVNILNRILNSDQAWTNAMDTQWVVLSIITKIGEWLIVNSVDDGEFLMCVWHTMLNVYNNGDGSGSNSIGPAFNWTEIIRLLSHSIYGYPNDIERHRDGICTCKRVPIDWNGATLLFIAFDSISNGMSQLEKKSLINDLLNTIPDNLQMNLLEGISQLTNFLNDAIDFPHKHIPVRCIPATHAELFYRCIAIADNDDDDMRTAAAAASEATASNYGPYNREQVITMDLAINPKRYRSWLELLRIKISQFDKLYDAIDLTGINFVDVENAKNAIDTCFNKCQMFNRAETISTVDHLWYYGLHSYKLANFFMTANDGGGNGNSDSINTTSSSSSSSNDDGSGNGYVMRSEFNGIYTPKSSMFGWNRVSKVLRQLCLTKCPSLFIDAQQKFRCCFMLGKMAEKQQPMAITEALKYYLMAEQQLFDQQQDGDDDDNNNTDGAEDASLIQTKIEMNFRITASIYKFVARYMAGSCANSVNNDARAGSTATVATGIGANDDELLQQLMHVLQRDKSRLFTENQLAKRVKQMNELVDENANKVNGAEQQQQNRVNDIHQLCADDFEWYLELWPIYYKAVYYLAKINMKIDDNKCRALLLQLPRKANDAAAVGDGGGAAAVVVEKKLSLFDVHRNRQLFKVQHPLQLDGIHGRASFNKFMEKCVKILIEYLATKRNPHSQFVLALQWCRLAQTAAATSAPTSVPLNRQQIHRLFDEILKQFVATASTHVQLNSRNAAKSKAFAEFFQSIYELYVACEMHLRQSTLFPAYSTLLITSYHLCSNASADVMRDNDVEFQSALDFGAKKSNEKQQLKMNNKTAKKLPSNKDTPAANAD